MKKKINDDDEYYEKKTIISIEEFLHSV